MKTKRKRANQDLDAGRISLQGETVEFSSEIFDDWAVSMSDIALIGEYTNADGPCFPDYFWVLVAASGKWNLAPMEAEGEKEFAEALKNRFDGPWAFGLCGVTQHASRVLWPKALAGHGLFRFEPVAGKGWKKLPVLGWLHEQFEIRLTDEVTAYLGAASGH